MNRRLSVVSIWTATLCMLSVVFANPAHAVREACAVEVGKETPVLFVHGFDSSQNIWIDSGFESFTRDKTRLPTDRFNYEKSSRQWVTNPQIGKALATRILCLAESSRKGGGQGKVVVVAHSMGGLATRQAVAEDPAVAKALGMVVTIATPNYGSEVDYKLANTVKYLCPVGVATTLNCRAAIEGVQQALTAIPGLAADSQEIRKLAGWPKGVPIYAIGGNIALHYNLFGLEFDGPYTDSDALVTVPSALYSQKVNGLGGRHEFKCIGGPPPLFPSWTRGSCEHSALVHDEAVQSLVVEQIKKYVRSTVTPVRQLPEDCHPTAFYQGPGFTLQASVQVASGSVSCGTAVKIAQSFLEKSGADPITVVDQWRCSVTGKDSRGFTAECTSSEGKIRLYGE